jgi:hypothetical protein
MEYLEKKKEKKSFFCVVLLNVTESEFFLKATSKAIRILSFTNVCPRKKDVSFEVCLLYKEKRIMRWATVCCKPKVHLKKKS